MPFITFDFMYNNDIRKGIKMRWKLDINEKYTETNIMIQAPKMTKDISTLTTVIDQLSHTILVKKDKQQKYLEITKIIYIENVERITFIYTASDMYEVDQALYEVEEHLSEFGFIRINKQTLINPRSIQSVKALLNSRFELFMTSGEKLIVTRHYRNTFKALFEKGGLYDA